MKIIFAILLLSCSASTVNAQQHGLKTDTTKSITYHSILISDAGKILGRM